MKIAIINLTRGGLSGGYRKYLKKILPLIEQHSGMESMKVYVPVWIINSLQSSPRTQLVSLNDFKGKIKRLRKDIKDSKPDVVFIPTARWINTGSVPCVIMIRNMLPLIDPILDINPFFIIKNLCRAYVAKQSCFKADKIIAVSSFVRDFLIDNWKIREDKIEVIYHGCEKPAELHKAITPTEIPDAFSKDFIFTAGSICPYRGLEDLLEALMILKQSGFEKKLVIAGKVDISSRKYMKRLHRLAKRFGIKDQIVWTGDITAEKMSWCYYNCSIFVMTSRIEACPNIALEAMAHSCICISTESSPMPEFFRESALYYPPQNAIALADQLNKVNSFPIEEKNRMKEYAKKRSADFTWEKCAVSTMELLLKIKKKYRL